MIVIYNEDCLETMKHIDRVNVILTSPPYNTGKNSNSKNARNNHDARYDIHIDNKTQQEYCDWCVKVFTSFDNILKKDGVVLWNISYGVNSTSCKNAIGNMWLSIADIIKNTSFTVADRIIWKKKSALPNNSSRNKLTRIVEDIFVFCRKDEFNTFQCNKQVKSISHTGQKFYENIFNYVEAKNNDGACLLNKATFSTELVLKLLEIYVPQDISQTVYDPFAGTCTTAVACKKYGVNCICSELSENQCEYGRKRIA